MTDDDPYNYYSNNNGYNPLGVYDSGREPKPEPKPQTKEKEKEKPKAIKVNHEREEHDDDSITDAIIDVAFEAACDSIFGDM